MRSELNKLAPAIVIAACCCAPAWAAGGAVEAGSATEAVLFYVFGGMAALCAIGCALTRNIVRMALCLFGTLGAVAVLYFLLAASFVAAIQLIVYAGGTLIVIIFGVMLTAKSPWTRFAPRPIELVAGVLVCLALFSALVAVLAGTDFDHGAVIGGPYTVAQIGEQLLTTYLVPFELASVLLLAVMIGAAYLARRERPGRGEATDRSMSE